MRLQLFCAFLTGAVAVASAQAPSAQAKQAPDPRSLVLTGDRFKPLQYDDMTPEQKTMIEHLLAGERKGAGGPFNILLRSPEVGDLGQQFGGAMRFRTGLPRDVSETIIIKASVLLGCRRTWSSPTTSSMNFSPLTR
jgi:4-carboxymuconolactone decarboxylase